MNSPTVVEENERLVINWPDPKPLSFEITAECFTDVVAQINDLRDEVERLLRPS